jgi:hypothetical protein
MLDTPVELKTYAALAAKLVAALTHWHVPAQASVPIQPLVKAAQAGRHGLYEYFSSQPIH